MFEQVTSRNIFMLQDILRPYRSRKCITCSCLVTYIWAGELLWRWGWHIFGNIYLVTYVWAGEVSSCGEGGGSVAPEATTVIEAISGLVTFLYFTLFTPTNFLLEYEWIRFTKTENRVISGSVSVSYCTFLNTCFHQHD